MKWVSGVPLKNYDTKIKIDLPGCYLRSIKKIRLEFGLILYQALVPSEKMSCAGSKLSERLEKSVCERLRLELIAASPDPFKLHSKAFAAFLLSIPNHQFFSKQGYIIRVMGMSVFRMESEMKNEQSVPETKGVTIELLNAFDLGPEIEGLPGRQFRKLQSDHRTRRRYRPLSRPHRQAGNGSTSCRELSLDHRYGVAREYGPGLGWPAGSNTLHWLDE